QKRSRISYDFTHESRSVGTSVAAGPQILDDVADAPAPEPGPQVAGQVRSDPVLDHRAAERLIVALRAEHSLRRVARAAMPESLDEVCAAVPLRGHRWIAMERVRRKVERVPADEARSDVDRERQAIARLHIMNGGNGLQISKDRVTVGAGDNREMRVGQRRIEVLASRRYAVVKRAVELVVGPGADPILAIAREVRRIDNSEGGLEAEPPLERTAAPCGMA